MTVAFDTNIFIYAIDHDAGAKHRRARELFRRAAFAPAGTVVALQCLGEFVHVASRKLGLPIAEAGDLALRWAETFQLVGAEIGDLDRACNVASRHRVSFWDALLWATVHRAGVRYLVTEDLQEGRDLGGVVMLNPFIDANDALIDRLLPAADLG